MASNGYDVASAATSSLLDFAGSNIMANSANAKSKRQALTNFWMQNYFMDKQNEYNKPINQMKRLREAGLNPNLVYDNGNAIIASASPSGGAMADVTPASGSFRILDKLQAINAMKQQDANIKETEARTDAIDTNIALKEKALRMSYALQLARMGLIEKQIGRIGVQNEKTRAEKKYLEGKPTVTFSSDPVGYVAGLGNSAAGLLGGIHDATLDLLQDVFGERQVNYMNR